MSIDACLVDEGWKISPRNTIPYVNSNEENRKNGDYFFLIPRKSPCDDIDFFRFFDQYMKTVVYKDSSVKSTDPLWFTISWFNNHYLGPRLNIKLKYPLKKGGLETLPQYVAEKIGYSKDDCKKFSFLSIRQNKLKELNDLAKETFEAYEKGLLEKSKKGSSERALSDEKNGNKEVVKKDYEIEIVFDSKGKKEKNEDHPNQVQLFETKRTQILGKPSRFPEFAPLQRKNAEMIENKNAQIDFDPPSRSNTSHTLVKPCQICMMIFDDLNFGIECKHDIERE